MRYRLVVSVSANPNQPVFTQDAEEPFMAMNVGDYFSYGNPMAPPSSPTNGFILRMRHAIFPGPNNVPVCGTWILLNEHA